MEHLHHFGLTQDPFSNEPDLRFYFESASHRDAQRRVERGIRQYKGLTLLTAEGGMGKTLLARRILESLEEEVFEAALLVMLPGAADATSVIQRFARQIGCESPAADRATLIAQLYEQLAIIREDGRHAVLLIDDTQILSPVDFAELTGLLNLEYEDRRLLSMCLVGSPELDRLVQNDSGIQPRIDVRVQMQPLDMANSTAYLQHRLALAQGAPEILPAAAMEALYKLGRGRPRLLNTLADNALYEAFLAGRSAIDPADVERAAFDLGIGPDPGSTWQAPGPSVLRRPESTISNPDRVEPSEVSGLIEEAEPLVGGSAAVASLAEPAQEALAGWEMESPFAASSDALLSSPDHEDGFDLFSADLDIAEAHAPEGDGLLEQLESTSSGASNVSEFAFLNDGGPEGDSAFVDRVEGVLAEASEAVIELPLDDVAPAIAMELPLDDMAPAIAMELPLDDVAPAAACEVESEFAFDRDGFGTFEESALDSGQALFGKADLILEMEPLLEGEPLEYDEADVLDDAYVELLEE